MIPEELKARIETYLRCKWTGSLAYGPVPYNPPSKEQAENLGITYEEAVEFYDYLLKKKSKMIEVSPGMWGFRMEGKKK